MHCLLHQLERLHCLLHQSWASPTFIFLFSFPLSTAVHIFEFGPLAGSAGLVSARELDQTFSRDALMAPWGPYMAAAAPKAESKAYQEAHWFSLAAKLGFGWPTGPLAGLGLGWKAGSDIFQGGP